MNAPRAGELKWVAQFRRASLVDDGFSDVEQFADHGTTKRVKKLEVSDGERWRAAQVSATITARFQIRSTAFSRDLTPADRLIVEDVEYGINGIREMDAGRQRWLEISATAEIKAAS